MIYSSWAKTVKNAHHHAEDHDFWHIYWRSDVERHLVKMYIRELQISIYPQMLWEGDDSKW